MKKSINEIIEMIDLKQLHYDKTTQRNFIYNEQITNKFDGAKISRAGNVIKSIIQYEIQLPALYFWKNNDDSSYNIHDGKQRILSIYYFVKNEMSVTTHIEKEEGRSIRFYDDLTKNEQNKFLNYKFDITVKDGPIEKEEFSFDTINSNSVPLTNYECIRGMFFGKWIEGFETFINKMSKSKTLINKIGRGKQAILFLYANFYLFNDKKKLKNNMYTYLWKRIKDLRHSEFNYLSLEEMIDIYTRLENEIKSNKKTTCLELAEFICIKNWNQKPYLDKILKYYDNTDDIPCDTNKWSVDVHKIAISQLIINNIYCDKFRLFNDRDKSSLYRDKPKCNIENCEVQDYKDLNVDHKNSWSNGGETILENAQLLCKSHNSSKKDMNYDFWVKYVENKKK